MNVSLARALIMIVVAFGYLALAVLGAGGIRAFLARPQFVALALMLLALMATALFTVGGFIRRKNEVPAGAGSSPPTRSSPCSAATFPPTPTASVSGRSTATCSAGSEFSSLRQAVSCAWCRSSSSVVVSAA
jgi:Flp pilus assembly protein protease CpaA